MLGGTKISAENTEKTIVEKYHEFIQEILYHCEDCDQAIDPEDTERYIAPPEQISHKTGSRFKYILPRS